MKKVILALCMLAMSVSLFARERQYTPDGLEIWDNDTFTQPSGSTGYEANR